MRAVTVTIVDEDIPTLSISAPAPVKEGNNATANFTITSDILPLSDLTVSYLPVSTRFLPFGISSNQQQLTIPKRMFTSSNGQFTATLSQAIEDDMLPELNGMIEITLQDESPADVNYSVDSSLNSATANVEDDDSLIPVLVVASPEGGSSRE